MDSAMLWVTALCCVLPCDLSQPLAPHTAPHHPTSRPHKLPNPWTLFWLYSYASAPEPLRIGDMPALWPRLIQCRSASLLSADTIHGFGQSASYAIGNSILYTLYASMAVLGNDNGYFSSKFNSSSNGRPRNSHCFCNCLNAVVTFISSPHNIWCWWFQASAWRIQGQCYYGFHSRAL